MSLFLFITENGQELITLVSHMEGTPAVNSRNYSMGSYFPVVFVPYPPADFKKNC